MPAPVVGAVGTHSGLVPAGVAINLAAPTGVVDGSVVLIALRDEDLAAVHTVPGFSLLATHLNSSAYVTWLFWKRASGPDPGPYVLGTLGGRRAAVALRVDGASRTADPFEGYLAADLNTTNAAPPLVGTSSGADELLLYVGDNDALGTWTQVPGFTIHSNAQGQVVASRPQPVAGSSGTVTATSQYTGYKTAQLLYAEPFTLRVAIGATVLRTEAAPPGTTVRAAVGYAALVTGGAIQKRLAVGYAALATGGSAATLKRLAVGYAALAIGSPGAAPVYRRVAGQWGNTVLYVRRAGAWSRVT